MKRSFLMLCGAVMIASTISSQLPNIWEWRFVLVTAGVFMIDKGLREWQ